MAKEKKKELSQEAMQKLGSIDPITLIQFLNGRGIELDIPMMYKASLNQLLIKSVMEQEDSIDRIEECINVAFNMDQFKVNMNHGNDNTPGMPGIGMSYNHKNFTSEKNKIDVNHNETFNLIFSLIIRELSLIPKDEKIQRLFKSMMAIYTVTIPVDMDKYDNIKDIEDKIVEYCTNLIDDTEVPSFFKDSRVLKIIKKKFENPLWYISVTYPTQQYMQMGINAGMGYDMNRFGMPGIGMPTNMMGGGYFDSGVDREFV